jgi:hypothetical protein
MRKPLTGEPYAGEPHVRFGGRGGESLLYPYSKKTFRIAEKTLSRYAGNHIINWIPACAGMT